MQSKIKIFPQSSASITMSKHGKEWKGMGKNGNAEIQGGKKWNAYAMEKNINSIKEAKNGMLIENVQSYLKSKEEKKDRYSLQTERFDVKHKNQRVIEKNQSSLCEWS